MAKGEVKFQVQLERPPGPEPQYHWISETREVMVFDVGEGVRVFSSICPHMGARLCLSTGSLSCPWHGWKFDLKAGRSDHHLFKNLTEYKAEFSGGQLKIFE